MYCNKCGNKVDDSSTYCNKCGNYIKSNSNPVQTPINNIEHKKSNKLLAIVVGSIVGLLVVVIFVIIYGHKNGYFFSEEGYDGNAGRNVEPGVSGNKNLSSTVIITDNVYYGMSISSVADANNLISKDSTDQKDKCPKEIIKVENNIISKYGITAVNLCEMDVNFANELQSVFETIYNEFPSARGHLTNLSLKNTSILSENGVIAQFMPIFQFATSNTESEYPYVLKTQVFLSSAFFLNKAKLEASVKDGSSSGHFPPNATIYSPVAHELGHYLSFLALMNSYNIDSLLLMDENNYDAIYSIARTFGDDSFSLSMLQEAYNNYVRDTNSNIDFDEWRGTISQYALAKDNNGEYIYDETVAEAFHDVYLNKNSACDASKYIITVLKNKLEN